MGHNGLLAGKEPKGQRCEASRSEAGRGTPRAQLVEAEVHHALRVVERHRKRDRLGRIERAGRPPEGHLRKRIEREAEEQLGEVEVFGTVGVLADDGDEPADVLLDGRRDDAFEVAGCKDFGGRLPLHPEA